LAFLGLTLTSTSTWAQTPDQLIELKASGARVYAATRIQALTAPAATPAAAVQSFLAARGKSAGAIGSLVPVSTSRTAATGVTHLRFSQSVNGFNVYGAYVKAAVNARSELIHLIEILPEPPGLLVPSNVSARAALDAALSELYPERTFRFNPLPAQGNTTAFNSGDNFFFRNPTATRIALPLASGAMQQGWLVETWTRMDNQLHHSVIGNGARVLGTEQRTANESYKIFTEHPQILLNGSTIGADQTTLNGPVPGNTESLSPNGWISSEGRTAGVQSQFRLSGNNVYAYLDTDANNSPDAAGTTITNGEFTATAVETDAPTTNSNRQVAIQNLFWASNVIHDKLYFFGFNEEAGNFQQNNFGKGGSGNDSVLAEAQDGSGTNNANFSTPADGSSPRMQMYLWNLTSPNRDGDVDTDIVYHEYGHGLTWRMIGSMSGCMSGAIGEGASDTLAILMNNDDVVGEYSYNNPNGIRRFPYTNYPRTYGSLSTEGVHAAGELFAAIMWRAKASLGNDNLTWKYLVDGMNYIPAGPRFENMRDGIVQSAGGLPTGDACKVYKAFADFGVGQGATGSCATKGFIFQTTSWNVTQSFTVPAACQSPVTDLAVTAINAPASVAPGSTTSVSVTVTNVGNQPVSSDFNVTLDTTLSASVTGGLVAGASTTKTFAWTAPASTGAYPLVASHTYGDGSTGNNSLTKSVTVSVPSPISLSATARNQKGSRYADLVWSGATGPNVDLYKNGALLRAVPNSGAYSEGPQPKGTTTATYKICETAPATACSSSVSVAF